ncbi:MAG: EAL domain-containing protein [Lachnospiraceae bacterium]|nr:EAL domain-containing protein [Lachnospiraceae bacterium]
MCKMTEQELIESFPDAIKYNHIFVYYQPQVNHNTGRMIGAEALIRWKHPVYGIQYPSDFIPILEKNNLIIEADIHVFRTVCDFIKRRLDAGLEIVPISVNMSRYDIYNNDYVDRIEEIRKEYDVPVKYLRIEITESSAIGGIELVKNVLEKLHSYGYLVEMDDFGSGYSSLNILKDLAVDIIKLDMVFLRGAVTERGGIIVTSIVQMARWLNTPIIVEGVETVEQADYMKSIGCNYIQGYLYAKPMDEDNFVKKLDDMNHEVMAPAIDLIDNLEAGKFWNPKSLETLIFSNYVGAAAVFTYDSSKKRVEIIRVNNKYVKEVGLGRSEKQIIKDHSWKDFDEENYKIYGDTIKRAVKSGEEETCETWRKICTDMCGEDRVCIKTEMRVIGRTGDIYMLYAMVHNITEEKKSYSELYESERRFRFASEQANVYAWEYDIRNKEMRPCFRCMRDLKLPPLLKNYPEPAIEVGIFPPDYADMYRDWHKQLEKGVDHLEAIIPLTVGRVPFHVRYTTEYDENGKPIKAYGSATLVIEEDEKGETDGAEKIDGVEANAGN